MPLDASRNVTPLRVEETDVVIVDCADMGKQPGDYSFFDNHSGAPRLRTDSVSTHGLGLGEALSLARTLGFKRSVWCSACSPLTFRRRFR